MPLVQYIPDAGRYDNVFVSQFGTGVMVRYRGSPYQNGSGFIPQILKNLFSKIGNFVKPLLRQVAPHAKAALYAASPHLKEAANGVIKDVTSQATEAIAKRLAAQEGNGKRRRTGVTKKKRLRLTRIPPFNIPDSF